MKDTPEICAPDYLRGSTDKQLHLIADMIDALIAKNQLYRNAIYNTAKIADGETLENWCLKHQGSSGESDGEG